MQSKSMKSMEIDKYEAIDLMCNTYLKTNKSQRQLTLEFTD